MRTVGFQWMIVLGLLAVALGGCGTRRTTDTPRTASEQLLISAAVDRAVAQLDFSPLRDTKVFVLDALVDRADKTFLVATVRMHAWYAGCIVVQDMAEADAIIEIRSGGVGVDRSEYLLGIPAAVAPTPFGEVPIPETALFKSVKQIGASRVSFVAYRADDRRFLYTSGPFYGFSDQRSWWLMGAGPSISDNIQPKRNGNNTVLVDVMPTAERQPPPAPIAPTPARPPGAAAPATQAAE